MHTDASGERDVALADTSRAYLIASAQHGPGRLAPGGGGAKGNDGLHATNPNDFRPAIRALVCALDQWVAQGVLPPPSQYPRIADGTLVPPKKAGWPAVPGVRFPLVRNEPVRVAYGPEWARGVIAIEPPHLGRVFPALVPAVDADGNDRAGIRLPEVEVPLAAQTGWNWRHPATGAPDALAAYRGSYLPFAWTKAEREATGDPRLAVEERYRSREDYLGRVALAAIALVRERFLLAQDLPFVFERAAAHWDGRAATAAERSPTGR
jgi:Alpha/beta hydrolase domain